MPRAGCLASLHVIVAGAAAESCKATVSRQCTHRLTVCWRGKSLLVWSLDRLVHRLDRDASGCLVIARTADSAAWLSQAFAQHASAALNPNAVYKGMDIALLTASPGFMKMCCTERTSNQMGCMLTEV